MPGTTCAKTCTGCWLFIYPLNNAYRGNDVRIISAITLRMPLGELKRFSYVGNMIRMNAPMLSVSRFLARKRYQARADAEDGCHIIAEHIFELRSGGGQFEDDAFYERVVNRLYLSCWYHHILGNSRILYGAGGDEFLSCHILVFMSQWSPFKDSFDHQFR